MKPREWKIFGIACVEKGSAAYDNFQWNEGAVHAIEKPAYDRLEAMCEKLGAAAVKLGLVKDLYNPDYIPSVRDLIDAEDEFRKVLTEYRAMRDETKMPCPDKDIDPLG